MFYESKWIGHSAKIAQEHYLQVREEDFERAVGEGPSGNSRKKWPETVFPAVVKNLPAIFPAAQGETGLHDVENVQWVIIR